MIWLESRFFSTIAFVLAGFATLSALLVGLFSYRTTLDEIEKRYHASYLSAAEMLVKAAELQGGGSNAEMVKTIETIWRTASGKPADEYICIVDPDARLLLHTADPETRGSYCGRNVLTVNKPASRPILHLRDLLLEQKPYVGDYISSSGEAQIAAFVPIAGRNWLLGLHRSKAALTAEIARSVFPFKVGFLLICGVLMPLSLLMLYLALHSSQKRRQRTLAALAQSEERFRSLVQALPCGVQEVNPAGIITFTNQGHDRIFQCPPDKRIGSEIWDMAATEADLRELQRYFRSMSKEEVQPATYFEKCRTGNGEIIDLQVDWAAKRDEKGLLTGFIAILTEITRRRQMEQEKEDLLRQLQQSQKLEAIGTLAGGIAHDFNNILTAIIGYCELALREPRPEKPDDDLREILKAGQRAKDLVRQILAFSRQEQIMLKPITLAPIIKEGVKLLGASLPKSVEIRQHIAADDTRIMADSTQIHQVLMNLCTNAAYAMREKGGILEIELDEFEAGGELPPLYRGLPEGRYLRLVVKDTGCGMDPETVEKIFHPFFTTKAQGEGTGLGLSVAHGIVKSHKGAILVESSPGRGSSFHLLFPAVKAMAGDTCLPRAASLPGGKERILLVDDDPEVIRIGQKMLAHLGYRVECLTSGNEALALFRAEADRFALVITDQSMPVMTGLELAREILRLRQVPVIICTGFSEILTEENIRSSGIKATIMKPLIMGEFACTIRKVLDENF